MGKEEISLEWIKNDWSISHSDKLYLKKIEKDVQENSEIKNNIIKDLVSNFFVEYMMKNYHQIKDWSDDAALVQFYLKYHYNIDLEIDGILSKQIGIIKSINDNTYFSPIVNDYGITKIDPFFDFKNDNELLMCESSTRFMKELELIFNDYLITKNIWNSNNNIPLTENHIGILNKVYDEAKKNSLDTKSLLEHLKSKYNVEELLLNYSKIPDWSINAALVQLFLKLRYDLNLAIDGNLSTNQNKIDPIIKAKTTNVDNAEVDALVDDLILGKNEDDINLFKLVLNEIIDNCNTNEKEAILKEKSVMVDMSNRPYFYKMYLSNKRQWDSLTIDDWITVDLLKAIGSTKLESWTLVNEWLVMHHIKSLISQKFWLDVNNPLINSLSNYKVNPSMLTNLWWLDDIKELIIQDRSPMFYLQMLNVYFKWSVWQMKPIFYELLSKSWLYETKILDYYLDMNNPLSYDIVWLLLDDKSKASFIDIHNILSNNWLTTDAKVADVKKYMEWKYQAIDVSNEFVNNWFPLLMRKHNLTNELKEISNKNILILAVKHNSESSSYLTDEIMEKNFKTLFWDIVPDTSQLKNLLQEIVKYHHNEYINLTDNNEETISRSYDLKSLCNSFYYKLNNKLKNEYWQSQIIEKILEKLNPNKPEWLKTIYTLLRIDIDEKKQSIVNEKASEIVSALSKQVPEFVNWNYSDASLLSYVVVERLSNPNITDEELKQKYIIDKKIKQDIVRRLNSKNITTELTSQYSSLLSRIDDPNISNNEIELIKFEKYRLDALLQVNTIRRNAQLLDVVKNQIETEHTKQDEAITLLNSVETNIKIATKSGDIASELAKVVLESKNQLVQKENEKNVQIRDDIEMITKMSSNDKLRHLLETNQPDTKNIDIVKNKLDTDYKNWTLQKAAVSGYHENISKEYFRDDYLKWKKEQVESTEEKSFIPQALYTEKVSQNISQDSAKTISIPNQIEYISSTKLVDPFDNSKSIEWVWYFDINSKLLQSFLKNNWFDEKIQSVALWMNHDDFQKIFGLSLDKKIDKEFFNKFVDQLGYLVLNYIDNNINKWIFSPDEISFFRELKVELLFGDLNMSLLKFLKYKDWKYLKNLGLIDINNNFNFSNIVEKNQLESNCFIDINSKLNQMRQDSQKLQF